MNVASSSAKPEPRAAAPAANRVLLAVTVALAVVTAAAAAAYLALALQWRQGPFIGVLVSRNLVVDGSYSLTGTPWPGLAAGLQRRDHIVSLNGQALAAAPDAYDEALYNFHSDVSRLNRADSVTVGFVRAPEDGPCPAPARADGLCAVTFTPAPFPIVDFIGFFLAPFLTGLVCFSIGAVVLWLRPNQPAAVLIGAACLLLALVLFGLFDTNTSHALVPLWIAAVTLLGAVITTLALVFPVRSVLLYQREWLAYVPLGLGLLAAAALVSLVFAPPDPTFQVGTPAFALVFGAIVVLSLNLLHHRRRATSLTVRDQSNTVLIGLVLSAVPVVIWIVNTVAQVLDGAALVPFNVAAGTPFAILAPLSLAYAVLQYRVLDTDRIISQGITYGLMLLALVVGYFLLVFSASLLITQGQMIANNPLFVGLTVFVMALLFLPVRNFIQARIDRLYYRTRFNYQQYIDAFTHDIARARDVDQVVARLGEILDKTLQPETLFVFVPHGQSSDFVAAGSTRRATDIHFAPDTGILAALEDNDQLVHLEPRRPWPPAVRSESARLRILSTRLIVGMRGSSSTAGFVCLGAPHDGSGVYDYEQVLFVQNLISQMAVAVERAQVIDSLERRVSELKVLSQVSQAANFRVDLDDLLELISTQASRLIDAPYFYIALADDSDLFFAFFLENDERDRQRENQPWPLGRDLFSEVVRTGQSLHFDDYAAALAQRAADARISPQVRAWMGVPLATNTQMLGVMAVGTDQPGKTYGKDQLDFFRDIALLAATSIEKTRLFEETNQRARQLVALNEVSSALAGELNLDKLLELVTHSAVDILNAEAGSLLLRAEDSSSELEFRIAVGSVGQDLVGSRVSIRRGLVGEVASTGRTVIVNNALTDTRWGGEQSPTGFETRTVLAVPLSAKGQTIGVLEILNKRDNKRFDDEDARLLSTFAVQAAVAIENVRLFSLTDAQLNARVSELETLEQVDTELNRTLDLNQVADIAIRWAMNITSAPAAALGLVTASPPRLEIIAAVGYDAGDHPVGAEGRLWPLTGAFARVLRQRRGDMVSRSSMDFVPCLNGSTSQIILPMVAGGDVNGMLIVETNRDPQLTLVHLAQLYRLSDHAGIALANAQLYAELTRANDSKSEFVSFVAHELKTPMTSIKGYTDLLLMGRTTSQLDPQQETFLRTIRANIERMNTLVSDLNDVTKMETNNLHMELGPVDFANVVTETLRPLQRQIEDRQQALEISLPADLPPLYGDQNRLIQVLTNLLSNAHKYTPTGGRITITGEVVPNRWNARSQPAEPVCHVMVRDTGIGMTPEDVNKLFTPYFRSENPLAREQPGTGLGLTIVRGIVERHNGRIWVESELGQGTVFHFIVPLAPAAEAEPSAGD